MDEEHASMAIFGNFDPVIPPKEFICFEMSSAILPNVTNITSKK